MWVITVYTDESNIKMFEFEDEKEAREFVLQVEGSNKILSHVVYFNDRVLEAAV